MTFEVEKHYRHITAIKCGPTEIRTFHWHGHGKKGVYAALIIETGTAGFHTKISLPEIRELTKMLQTFGDEVEAHAAQLTAKAVPA